VAHAAGSPEAAFSKSKSAKSHPKSAAQSRQTLRSKANVSRESGARVTVPEGVLPPRLVRRAFEVLRPLRAMPLVGFKPACVAGLRDEVGQKRGRWMANTASPRGPMRVNNAEALSPALRSGFGLALQPDFMIPVLPRSTSSCRWRSAALCPSPAQPRPSPPSVPGETGARSSIRSGQVPGFGTARGCRGPPSQLLSSRRRRSSRSSSCQ